MFNRAIAAFAFAALATALQTRPASAIPLFAQRFHLECTACHSVLPELNAFGNWFRDHGYRIPGLAEHGTTHVAVRYQLEYDKTPPSGSRRYSQGGILLSSEEVGAVNEYLHYNLGAGGGPSAMYLGYLAAYDARSHSMYRAGLIELPVPQSPGQRLDDLATYGYYGQHVGLNALTFQQPRVGLEDEKTVGVVRLTGLVDFGEFNGSAYGGAPVFTGVSSYAAAPEFGLFVRVPAGDFAEVGVQGLTGVRNITPLGLPSFDDPYGRRSIFGHARYRFIDLQAEQWWGDDGDADGRGTHVGSSGGYVRLKLYPVDHAYLGVRYDASAAPFPSRDYVFYAAGQIWHTRLLLERRQPLGGGIGTFEGALTVGFPGPLK